MVCWIGNHLVFEMSRSMPFIHLRVRSVDNNKLRLCSNKIMKQFNQILIQIRNSSKCTILYGHASVFHCQMCIILSLYGIQNFSRMTSTTLSVACTLAYSYHTWCQGRPSSIHVPHQRGTWMDMVYSTQISGKYFD
jgi:hypothetical protein